MIDPNEAPEGYEAHPIEDDEEFNACHGCALIGTLDCLILTNVECCSLGRKDKTEVIFKRKEEK